MAHKIPQCIEWLTSIHTLEPGDIVATGTNHRGLNPFMDGDKVEIEIEGLGRLAFNIKDDLKRNGSAAPACNAMKRRRKRPPASTPTTPRKSPANTPKPADPKGAARPNAGGAFS